MPKTRPHRYTVNTRFAEDEDEEAEGGLVGCGGGSQWGHPAGGVYRIHAYILYYIHILHSHVCITNIGGVYRIHAYILNYTYIYYFPTYVLLR